MQNPGVGDLWNVFRAMLSLSAMGDAQIRDFVSARLSGTSFAPLAQELEDECNETISLLTNGVRNDWLEETEKSLNEVNRSPEVWKERFKRAQADADLLKTFVTPAVQKLTALLISNSELWWTETFEIADELVRQIGSVGLRIKPKVTGVSWRKAVESHQVQSYLRCHRAFLDRMERVSSLIERQKIDKPNSESESARKENEPASTGGVQKLPSVADAVFRLRDKQTAKDVLLVLRHHGFNFQNFTKTGGKQTGPEIAQLPEARRRVLLHKTQMKEALSELQRPPFEFVASPGQGYYLTVRGVAAAELLNEQESNSKKSRQSRR